jgi:hypothetical protein
MSSECYTSLQLGIAVDTKDVDRVLNHKPYQPKSEVAEVVLKGKVVGTTQVPVHDEDTEASWTVDGEVYSDFDDALNALCKPLKIGWGYAHYCGEISNVFFGPKHKTKGDKVSFAQMEKVVKDMPRVREVVKKVFGLKKVNEGVYAVMGRE